MISVVVPVYNLEKYITATLDSITSQGIPDMEVLLVDDKSTDSSVSVINDFSCFPFICKRRRSNDDHQ